VNGTPAAVRQVLADHPRRIELNAERAAAQVIDRSSAVVAQVLLSPKLIRDLTGG
jgi:hypothetical protein